MSGLIVQPEVGTKSVPRSWMELLSNFAATWGRPDGAAWGLHCSRCGQDVQAGNGISDKVLTAKCKCREYASDGYSIL